MSGERIELIVCYLIAVLCGVAAAAVVLGVGGNWWLALAAFLFGGFNGLASAGRAGNKH